MRPDSVVQVEGHLVLIPRESVSGFNSGNRESLANVLFINSYLRKIKALKDTVRQPFSLSRENNAVF